MISSFLESLGLFGSLMSLILLGRAAFVFPLSILSNYTTKSAGAEIGVRQMVPSRSFSHLLMITSSDTWFLFFVLVGVESSTVFAARVSCKRRCDVACYFDCLK